METAITISTPIRHDQSGGGSYNFNATIGDTSVRFQTWTESDWDDEKNKETFHVFHRITKINGNDVDAVFFLGTDDSINYKTNGITVSEWFPSTLTASTRDIEDAVSIDIYALDDASHLHHLMKLK